MVVDKPRVTDGVTAAVVVAAAAAVLVADEPNKPNAAIGAVEVELAVAVVETLVAVGAPKLIPPLVAGVDDIGKENPPKDGVVALVVVIVGAAADVGPPRPKLKPPGAPILVVVVVVTVDVAAAAATVVGAAAPPKEKLEGEPILKPPAVVAGAPSVKGFGVVDDDGN